jgi:hypothetical protein
MLRFALLLAGWSLASSCLADIREQSLARICSALYDTELRAGQWTTYEGGTEGCRSLARPVRPGETNGNQISFLAEGTNGAPLRVKLILTIVSPSGEDAAKSELIKATKRLSVRALGRSLPHAFDQAIMKGVPIKLTVGSGDASLTRTTLSQNGYVLSVIME